MRVKDEGTRERQQGGGGRGFTGRLDTATECEIRRPQAHDATKFSQITRLNYARLSYDRLQANDCRSTAQRVQKPCYVLRNGESSQTHSVLHYFAFS